MQQKRTDPTISRASDSGLHIYMTTILLQMKPESLSVCKCTDLDRRLGFKVEHTSE